MSVYAQLAVKSALAASWQWPWARRLREERYLAAPHRASKNLVFAYVPHRIPESQLYPFHRYRHQLRDEFGLRTIHVSLDNLERLERSTRGPFEEVELVCFQTWFDWSAQRVRELCERLKRLYPRACLVYYDCFAPVDLRMASLVDPFVTHYVKKNRLAQFSRYMQSHRGDTNLTDYYDELYGIEEPVKSYPLPADFERKLLTGHSFITAPLLEPLSVMFGVKTVDYERPIDLHARLGGAGSGWYGRMRDDARRRVHALGLHRVAAEGAVPFGQYLREMLAAKLTFSPFGYGEMCWRDFEAMVTGSLLLKPDVGHIDHRPQLFVPYETYVPLAWDFSDFEPVVRRYLADDRERKRIARNALEACRAYFREHTFSSHVRELVGYRDLQ